MSRYLKKIVRFGIDSILPYPFNHGYEFGRLVNFLGESQYWPREKLAEFQTEKLKALIDHAYSNVPYYNRIMVEYGVCPSDIQCIDDLKKLPLLTKDDLRKHSDDLKASNRKEFKPFHRHTSGSTGEPVHYWIDKRLDSLIAANVARHFSWTGVGTNSKIAIFRGTLIDSFGKPDEELIRQSGREIHFSTFRMNVDNLNQFTSILNSERPALIRGYPSSLAILADHINKRGGLKFQPQAIHVSSELLSDTLREVIEKAFSAKIFNWYSHGESAVAAGECELHNGLHLNEEFGITEFLYDAAGLAKRIVATSLWNYAMPIIRYDTEDLAELGEGECNCGRSLPLVKQIVGRAADLIYGINGSVLSPSSFVHFWKYRVTNSVPMQYYQVVQEDKQTLTIRLLKSDQAKIDEAYVFSRITDLLGSMTVGFEYLDQIPTGQKWRTTVSKLTGIRK